ncbi:putative reverse transcriptase domain-containing protein [Tanacetum coccineum]
MIPHHTPIIIQSSTQPQKTQKPRNPRKDTQVPQSSDPMENVTDVAVHKELGDSLVRATTTASSLEEEQDSGNITKTRSKATPNESSSLGITSGGAPWCQETMGDTTAQTRFESVSKYSNDSLLARGNTLQSDKDRLKLEELMALCTTLQNRVLDLEKTMTSQHNKIVYNTLRFRVIETSKVQDMGYIGGRYFGSHALKIWLHYILGNTCYGLESYIVMSDSEDSTVTYTAVSNPFRVRSEEDLEEDDDEDPEEDPTDYPTDRDDDDEEYEEPFGDETDDKEEDDDDEEEEEHPAPADSVPHLYIVLQLGYPSDLRHPYHFLKIQRSDVPPSGTPPILPIPLSTSSPSLLLPSTDHGADRPEVCLPPRKRLCFAFGPRYEVGESSSAPATRPTGGFRPDYGFIATLDREIRRDPEREVGYGITNTWDEMLEDMPGAPATDETELGRRMTNFVTTVRQDTYEIYVRLGEAQDERSLMSGRLNLLQRDRRAHAHTALLMEREARLSREAWGRSMDASDLARSEVMALRTQVVAQQSEIAALRAADRARQAQLVETLRLMSTLQTQVTALQGQLGPASGPAQPEIPEEAARDADQNTNGDDSHNLRTGVRRIERVAGECTYPDFMKCQPLNFKGTEGFVELIQWFEKMETVFSISNCSVENQIRFSTCTFLIGALTWWNSHVRTVGHDVAYAITWTYLKKKMTDKYYSRVEIKKLEAELMFPEESDKIERYVGGLPDMIYESVVALKPKTMKEAIEIATELMDKKIRTFAERQTENKIKQNDNQQQQQQNKRQNTGRAYTTRSGEKKPYGGSKPLCAKCNYHHDGPCAPKCHKCNRFGHLARDCRSTANANTANNQRGTRAGQKLTCYKCGARGYYKRDCAKLKNNNRGNQDGNGNAPAKVYAVGRVGTNPDSNVMTGTLLLNNRYASILIDTGVVRSFVSTAFSS